MKLKPGMKNISNPLYINANIIFSECLQIHKGKQSGTLRKLFEDKYQLVTSLLTKAEVIQRLDVEKSIPQNKGRLYFQKVVDNYEITILAGVPLQLTNAFFDEFCKSKLSLPDYTHLQIAKYFSIPICTHDKKMRKNGINHELKKKVYSKVYKPEELIKRRN